MELYNIVNKLIQIDNLRRTLVNNPSMEHEMDILFNHHLKEFGDRILLATDDEKAKAKDYLDELITKYDRIIDDLKDQEENYTNRADILRYINDKKNEAQFSIMRLEEIKSMFKNENIHTK